MHIASAVPEFDLHNIIEWQGLRSASVLSECLRCPASSLVAITEVVISV